MKKLIYALLLCFVAFASCEKEKSTPKTTYKIINNNVKSQSDIQYFDNTLWEVVVFKFKGDEVIGQDNIDSVAYSGMSKVIEVDENCEKVKVSFKLLPAKSEFYSLSLNNRKYLVSYSILKTGSNTDIVIDGNTMIQSTLKSTSSMTINQAIKSFK